MEAAALPRPATLAQRGHTLSAAALRLRSDDQLVALFRAGSDAAFCVIHDRYRPRLLAYARQMLGGSYPDAEDALQDVFVRAHAALRANDAPISLRAWLYRIAHNRCIDGLRRPGPLPSEISPGAEPALSRGARHDPPAALEQGEDLRRLVADLLALPDQQRSALLMRELQGLSYDELACSLGVSVGAVKSLLVRARGGILSAAVARAAPCAEICDELAAAHDRGVRPSGQVRRHLRECAGCRQRRAELRQSSRQLAALAPPVGWLALLSGLGGGGGAGGGIAAAGGSGAGVAGGGGGAALCGATSVAIGKVAVIVCAVALVGSASDALRTGQRPARARVPAARAAPRARLASARRIRARAQPHHALANVPVVVAVTAPAARPSCPPATTSPATAPGVGAASGDATAGGAASAPSSDATVNAAASAAPSPGSRPLASAASSVASSPVASAASSPTATNAGAVGIGPAAASGASAAGDTSGATIAGTPPVAATTPPVSEPATLPAAAVGTPVAGAQSAAADPAQPQPAPGAAAGCAPSAVAPAVPAADPTTASSAAPAPAGSLPPADPTTTPATTAATGEAGASTATAASPASQTTTAAPPAETTQASATAAPVSGPAAPTS